jgi:hypothetical protein
MTLTYTIDRAQRLVTIVGEYADADEWNTVLARVLDDPRYEPGFYLLRDLRSATTPVSAAAVVGVMDVIRRFWPLLQPTRMAVLTPMEFDPAALTAHAIADEKDIPLKVFSSYEDAVEWLQRGD